MELVSEHYRVCIDDQGLATVWKRELQVLVRTTLASGGQPQVESFTRAEAPDAATRQLLEHFDRTPFAQFAYAGEGHWHLDCEAGFQRWKGYVSGRSLSGSLERMGFAQDARNRILKACRAEIHAYMARGLLMPAHDLKNEAEHLEALVDRHGLETVLNLLAEICREKAEHLRCHWQDHTTARVWDRAASRIEAAVAKIEL